MEHFLIRVGSLPRSLVQMELYVWPTRAVDIYGSWFPLETSGGAFAAIGRVMPSAWAMNGFQNILIRGLGLASVWTAVAVLSAYAFFFFVLAVCRFRKMEA